ncbi:ComF family protein [Demequina gelatinilytica]|uniref:ComF family protein n=1 Tax=Demequina gelatinilytica TaxID=1638980 RepID=UPI0007852287|nr:ComF family protein [Demequina gelatinilytica]
MDARPRGPGALLARLVVPVACPGCREPDVRWCEACEAPWWERPLRCESGAPRLSAMEPPFAVWSIAPLDGPVHGAIAAWKDSGRRDLGSLLVPAMERAAHALVPALRDVAATVTVVPCPARAAHTRRRGVDVPAVLARAAAAGLARGGVEATVRAVLRPARGSSRGAGDRGRWRAGPPRPTRAAWRDPRPTAALLVDDVLTTGATLARATQALAASPLVPVAALVLASAEGPGQGPVVRRA